jgi:hypothetical protein
VKRPLPVPPLLRWDSNPLRRAVDRAEAVVTAGLIVAFMAAFVVLEIAAGRWADHDGLVRERSERSVHPVWATQLESGAQATASIPWAYNTAWVTARWKLPDGQFRTGEITVDLNSMAGQKQEIFINPAGQEVPPPMTSDGVRDQVIFAVFVVTMATGLAFASSYGCVRLLFNRRRMAGWQRAWDAIGPTWSRPR